MPGTTGGSPALLRHFTAAELASVQPVPVLVEFQDPPVAVFRAEHPQAGPGEVATYARTLHEAHRTLLRKLQQMGTAVAGAWSLAGAAGGSAPDSLVGWEFVDLFNGVGLRVPGAVVRELARLEGVRTITLDRPRAYLQSGTAAFPPSGSVVRFLVRRRGTPARGERVVIAIMGAGGPPVDLPGVRVISYKVLDTAGFGTAAHIVGALEDAVRSGAQVVHLPLGDAAGDPRSPEAVAAANALRAGVAIWGTPGGTLLTPAQVAGAWALLRQHHPDQDVLTLQAVLTGSARYAVRAHGAGGQGPGVPDLGRAALTRHVVTPADSLPPMAHHLGVVEHQGERVVRTWRVRVQDLGGATSPCRLGVRWLTREPGLRASLSRRGFLLATGGKEEVDLTLQVDGTRLRDGEYRGLVEASRGGLVMRLPFRILVRRRIPPEEAGTGSSAEA
ncbi:MAG: hypothetical protein L6E13_11150 [Firmicutes bacterium]|nr:hypothetical protein [Bacillota bacterium]